MGDVTRPGDTLRDELLEQILDHAAAGYAEHQARRKAQA